MNDDFKDHPKSIAEIKANKEHNGSTWTPRDALISLLREIDSGETKVTMLIIGYSYEDKDDPTYGVTNYVNSCPSAIHSWGLWSRVNHLLHHG